MLMFCYYKENDPCVCIISLSFDFWARASGFNKRLNKAFIRERVYVNGIWTPLCLARLVDSGIEWELRTIRNKLVVCLNHPKSLEYVEKEKLSVINSNKTHSKKNRGVL